MGSTQTTNRRSVSQRRALASSRPRWTELPPHSLWSVIWRKAPSGIRS